MAETALLFRPEQVDYHKQFNDESVSLEGDFPRRERAPATEVYGRSLSTIYRLGAFMVDKTLPEVINSPEANQARVEFYTSVEEGFGTDMELSGGLEVRDFDERPIISGRVMAKDLKTPISSMTEAGLICAETTAQKDNRFYPQLTRSKWDHENALIVDKMVRGETAYNTRIVISPFPEEAAAQSGDEYWQNLGYVPHLKRGFVQLYHAGGGVLLSGSLSFEECNKQRLRDVFHKFGENIPEEEITDNWLKYAITGSLSEEEAKVLAIAIADQAGKPKTAKVTNTVDVTHEYGPIMDYAFDSSYVHICESLFVGYQTKEVTKLIHHLANKAHHFNKHYAKALYKMRANADQFTDDDSAILHELLVYSTIEMMRDLHIKKIKQQQGQSSAHNNGNSMFAVRPTDPSLFQNMLIGFGAEGARNGRIYSACGLAISLGDKGAAESPQTAFGNALYDRESDKLIDEEKDKFGPLKFKCPNGHWNKRRRATSPKDFLPHCKTCSISLECKKKI